MYVVDANVLCRRIGGIMRSKCPGFWDCLIHHHQAASNQH